MKHLESIKNRRYHNKTVVDEVKSRLVDRDFRPFVKSQMFAVPNSPNGRLFIEMLREALNRETYTIRVRGYSSNRKAKGCDKNSVPLPKAEYFGVYIERKKLQEQTFPAEENPIRPFTAYPPPTVQRMDT